MTKYVLCLNLLLVALTSEASPVPGLNKDQMKRLETLYQDLHQNPELSGQEKNTAKKMAQEFRALGLEVIEGIGGTGVVGIAKNGKGPTTLVRAEMDALPVPEDTGLRFRSQTTGVMHACGHDYHMAALVGVAELMLQRKQDWKGTLVFVAQPAEEIVKGAQAMIQDGLFKKIPKPDQMLALHTIGKYKKGTIGLVPGYAMANVDAVEVVFTGRGTHGSSPEKGIDPFIMAAEFTLKMQTLVGREKEAMKPAVISVGSIHGGAKSNIIPDTVKLQLTVRSYDSSVRQHLLKRIVEVAKGIAATSGAPAPAVEFPEKSDAVFNDIELTQRLKQRFIQEFGANVIVDADPTMGGEDFGLFGQAVKAPSLMFWIGTQNPKDMAVINHSPKYDPDFAGTAPLAIKAMASGLLDLHKL